MILLRRKTAVRPERRDMALETAERRQSQKELKKRVDRLLARDNGKKRSESEAEA